MPTTDDNIEKLTPWVFEHAESADLFCVDRWPEEESKDYRDIFHLTNSYVSETNLLDASLAEPHPLQAYYPESQPYDPDRIEPGILEDAVGREELVTLPRKSWEYSTREEFAHLMTLQALVLRGLMESLYQKMGLRVSNCSGENGVGLKHRSFPVANHRQSYHLGGQKYAARPDGAVTIRTQRRDLPILSFTSEMFVLGFYKRQIFIARGFFIKDHISRVHSKGCSADETFTIAFTRGYDLSSKMDRDEAVEKLVGLLRYFLGGTAQIGGLQAFFDK
ncbi:hypothetical protein BO86DRAFT_422874 [Aspergillus japonicus CBS 114.51]|uniref:Uncharacterized protein n=1 Tax=Aspergillus japonicus CBS 114.51 TaxID=1448312 RepID=A0A8T8WLQ4_ASPJA|nr:hypothetical protein BO86DRAFT_422874 [Aspergillus japonicus CBS 114.51]RAH76768.1 hypothetical protein BO86DRAFT_422874 [Aspergillus japonicus CBS 114.51]